MIDIAGATYSIVGTDRAEALSGISIASCVGSLDLGIAVGMAPGAGVYMQRARSSSHLLLALVNGAGAVAMACVPYGAQRSGKRRDGSDSSK